MPKLERFKKDNNKPTTKHILISAGIIMGLLAIFVVYKSFALYTDKKTHDVIKSKIGSFDQEDMILTYTIDGVKSDAPFPKKINGYIANSVTCQNGVTASWDSESWGLVNINANNQTKIKCNVDFDGDTWEFSYIGDIQEFIAPKSGTYKLEIWGGSGGYGYDPNRATGGGGYGGFSAGTISIDSNDILYVVVGGEGESNCETRSCLGGYNGGSQSSRWANYDGTGLYTGGGGGATHIALDSGLLSSLSSHATDNRILIVAGGGGGGDYYPSWSKSSSGGSGGGFIGGVGFFASGGTPIENYGTQTTGYGFGLAGTTYTSDSTGGSGGGYYGGTSSSQHGTGSGGSGYIGNSNLNNKSMYCYGCQEDLTNESTFTVSTTGTSSYKDTTNCPNGYSSDPISKCAKEGNGFARITLVS